MFGLIARAGTLAINAGLIFVLSQHVPQLGFRAPPSKSAGWAGYHDTVLAGLERVRADLRENGKLLRPVREMMDALRPAPISGRAPNP
ncbi:MAG TPA: hypothetical protein VHC39_14070 [Rhizomicrobium sp.]|nr:hypothetical protein [Rhizomicrobium sp.]